MKISPSGFPGLLLVFLAGAGAYLLFGRQSFLVIMTILLVAGTITAILIRKHYNRPEQQAIILNESDDSLQQKQLSSDNKAAERIYRKGTPEC